MAAMSNDEFFKSGLHPGAQLGPYRIESTLGAGGMGEVFRARDTRLGRTVAIKVIRTEFSQRADFHHRFQREARAISALNHPHVCSLYDVGEVDGFAYLVMEYVVGATLAEVLQKGLLPLASSLCGMRSKLRTLLQQRTREGIVHRDLKPANIMITAAGVKVLDFGLAKRVESVDDDGATRTVSEQTRAGQIVGTRSYLSPEQAEGKTVDARSDVFSLGVVSLRDVVRNASLPRRHDVVPAREHPAGSPGTAWNASPGTSEGPRTDHPAMPGKETRSEVRVSPRTSSRTGSV